MAQRVQFPAIRPTGWAPWFSDPEPRPTPPKADRMEFWQIALTVNIIVTICYLMIAWIVGRGIHHSGQWRSNPLATATFLIFLSCGVGHGMHVEHLLLPGVTREASRTAFDLHLVMVDLATATIAIYYFLLRRKFPALLTSAAMFEDMEERRRQALDIHDTIVQELATAKLAMETGHETMGMAALTRGLEASKAIIDDLIGESTASIASSEAGGLRRSTSAQQP